MNFFKYISSNIVKWWQVHITPILHINNNKKGRGRFEGGDGSLENQYVADAAGRAVESLEHSNQVAMNQQVEGRDSSSGLDTNSMQGENGASGSQVNSDLLNQTIPDGTSADAMEVLNRINQEKDEARKRAVENQRKKREEEERIAAIMNAGKVNVNAFIEEGRSKAAENKESEDPAEVANESAETNETVESSTSDATEEQLRRAQEIIDRLNREAAEDEAKKQAEIDAAKQRAKESGLSD